MKIFKGKKYGIVHTRDITLDDIRAVFFPKDFYEKYLYLGAVPYNEEGKIFKAIYPLILALDNHAKPWWCPRWFLRFLHLFGSDNSCVRVRNFFLHNLKGKITKGTMIFDYKTKWEWYDLRISVHAPEEFQDMADAIEYFFYTNGRKTDLLEKIENCGIPKEMYHEFMTVEQLEKILTIYMKNE